MDDSSHAVSLQSFQEYLNELAKDRDDWRLHNWFRKDILDNAIQEVRVFDKAVEECSNRQYGQQSKSNLWAAVPSLRTISGHVPDKPDFSNLSQISKNKSPQWYMKNLFQAATDRTQKSSTRSLVVKWKSEQELAKEVEEEKNKVEREQGISDILPFVFEMEQNKTFSTDTGAFQSTTFMESEERWEKSFERARLKEILSPLNLYVHSIVAFGLGMMSLGRYILDANSCVKNYCLRDIYRWIGENKIHRQPPVFVHQPPQNFSNTEGHFYEKVHGKSANLEQIQGPGCDMEALSWLSNIADSYVILHLEDERNSKMYLRQILAQRDDCFPVIIICPWVDPEDKDYKISAPGGPISPRTQQYFDKNYKAFRLRDQSPSDDEDLWAFPDLDLGIYIREDIMQTREQTEASVQPAKSFKAPIRSSSFQLGAGPSF